MSVSELKAAPPVELPAEVTEVADDLVDVDLDDEDLDDEDLALLGLQNRAAGAAPSSSSASPPRSPPKAPPQDAAKNPLESTMLPSADDKDEVEDPNRNEALEYLKSLGKSKHALDKDELAQLNEFRRAVCRRKIIELAGSARKAFTFMDLNGSGCISSQEFEDGVRSLRLPWRELTAMSKPREFFKLFDEDKDQAIIFKELFPQDAADERAGLVRASTPDFCKRYNREREQKMRPAEWQPAGPDEALKHLMGRMHSDDDAVLRKKWIEATFRRLKSKGKSDARARELVALHLPRGSGPRDRQGVHTLSEVDLRKIRQSYVDELNTPIRDATKTMSDMRELRREQKQIIDKLYKVMEPDRAKERADAAVAAGLSGALGLFGSPKAPACVRRQDSSGLEAAMSLFGQAAPTSAFGLLMKAPMTPCQVAKEAKIDESEVDDLTEKYESVIGKGFPLSHKLFAKLLKAVAQDRNLADDDIDAFWKQVCLQTMKKDPAAVEPKKSVTIDNNALKLEDLKKMQSNFEQFALWYATSELRAPQPVVSSAVP